MGGEEDGKRKKVGEMAEDGKPTGGVEVDKVGTLEVVTAVLLPDAQERLSREMRERAEGER